MLLVVSNTLSFLSEKNDLELLEWGHPIYKKTTSFPRGNHGFTAFGSGFIEPCAVQGCSCLLCV